MSRPLRILVLWVLPLFAVVLFLYVLLGFLAVGPFLRAEMERRIAEETSRDVSIERVAFNPITLTLRIDGFDLRDLEGSHFIMWDRFVADLARRSIFGRGWTLDELAFDRLRIRLVIEEDGQPNFADLLEGLEPEEEVEDEDPPRFLVRAFTLRESEWVFEDRSVGETFTLTLAPVEFTLVRLDTRTEDAADQAFAAVSPYGERIKWEGDFSLFPLASQGQVRVDDIPLARYSPYYAEHMPLQVQSGFLSVDFRYAFRFADEPLREIRDGHVRLRNFALREPDRETPFLLIPELALEEIAVDGVDFAASAARLTIQRSVATLWRNEAGEVPLLQTIDKFIEERVKAEPAAELPDFALRLGRAEITGATIRLVDVSTNPEVFLITEVESIRIGNVTDDLSRPLPFEVSLHLTTGGAMMARGEIVPEPLQVDAIAEVNDLNLTAFSPYAGLFAGLHVTGGRLDLNLEATLAQGNSPFEAQATGRLSISGFEATSRTDFEPFASWELLEADSFSARFPEPRLRAESVDLRALHVHVVRRADETINLQEIFRLGGGDDEAGDAAVAPEAPPPEAAANALDGVAASLGTFRLTDGLLRFEDRSIPGGFSTSVERIEATITGLSTEGREPAQIEVRAHPQRAAEFEVRGSAVPEPDDLWVDLSIRLADFDLTRLSPYSAHYAGYMIADGMLRLNIPLRIANGDLEADIAVRMRGFELGEEVDSPEATGLPVGLAVSLLRDREGNIELELPVRGSVEDPDFQIGEVIAQAVGGIVRRAATAPFALLGALFGRGEELGYLDFEAGSTDLAPAESEKLADLANALHERPGVELEISPTADPQVDAQRLAQTRLEGRLEEHLRGADPDADDEGSLARDEALRRLHAEMFPEEPEPELDDPQAIAQIEERLLEAQWPDEEELLDLAADRAERLRTHLEEAGIESDRLHVTAPRLAEGGNRMNLSLQ